MPFTRICSKTTSDFETDTGNSVGFCFTFDIYRKTKTMKNWIKRGLLMIAVSFSLFGCGLFRKAPVTQETYGLSMKIIYDKNFSYAQFDSICVADTIPLDLKLWKMYSTTDYETNAIINEYMYIKRLGSNEELFRLMMVNDSTYNIYKRITYGNKEN